MRAFSCPETPVGGGGGLRPLWLCGLGRPPSFWALCPHGVGDWVVGESLDSWGLFTHTAATSRRLLVWQGAWSIPSNPPRKGAGLR